MRSIRFGVFGGALIASLALASPMAHAQFAVIDVSAIAQLVRQLSAMAQQLSVLQARLRVADQQYQAITGDRGMENLLSGTNWNYLPADWADLEAAETQTSTGFSGLGAAIQADENANAVLTPGELAALSPSERQTLTADRQSAALQQASADQALATTSSRFADVQQLIGAIGTATDEKAILDLQARIDAENGMLENEQTKVALLDEAAQAQQREERLQTREQAIEDIGSLGNLPPMGLR